MFGGCYISDIWIGADGRIARASIESGGLLCPQKLPSTIATKHNIPGLFRSLVKWDLTFSARAVRQLEVEGV